MTGTYYRGPSGREIIVVMQTQAVGPGLRDDAPLAQEKPSDLLEEQCITARHPLAQANSLGGWGYVQSKQ